MNFPALRLIAGAGPVAEAILAAIAGGMAGSVVGSLIGALVARKLPKARAIDTIHVKNGESLLVVRSTPLVVARARNLIAQTEPHAA